MKTLIPSNPHVWRRTVIGCAVALTATIARGEDPLLINGGSSVTRESTLNAKLADTQLGSEPCVTDADCDDGSDCTLDTCVNEACVNEAIAGCVPCQPELSCPPVDLVFVMDTSGSMKDEAAALCSTIDGIVLDLAGSGITVNPTILGISETPGSLFSCLGSDVVTMLGDAVPGTEDTCDFAGGASQFESWGPATAIVAERFPWTPGATRLIVPIADEGPCNGNRPDGCNDPGDDRDSIVNAISVAAAHGVIVSPITGTGATTCVTTLAGHLAVGTGGLTFTTSDADLQLPPAITQIVLETCLLDESCDDGDFCTRNDTCIRGACVGTPVDGCKPCTATGFCSDGNACTNDVCIDFECITSLNYDDSLYCCDPRNGALELLDDGNDCTVPTCDAETGIVTFAPRPDDTPCEDGLFCTIGAFCTDGVCNGGTPRDCSDLDGQCTTGICNEDAGACEATPVNEGEPCEDGRFCTVGETCAGGECSGGGPRDCSELDDDCNVGVCNEDTNECAASPTNEAQPCDDGLFCTEDETCANGACGGGTPRDCSLSGNVCNEGLCNDDLDQCEPSPANEGGDCNDGLYCTDGDTCTGGQCTGAPRDCSALDGDCSVGVCNENAATCEVEPRNEGLICSDGDSCTIQDRCRADGVCEGLSIDTFTCSTDAHCAVGTCNRITGRCVCDGPELCVKTVPGELPVEGCYDIGEDVIANIVLGASSHVITSGQLSVSYDPALLEFIAARPGYLVDAGSPFALEVSLNVDEISGIVCYTVATEVGEPGTSEEAIMASLHFRPREVCTTGEGLCLLYRNPCVTRLIDDDGQEVSHQTCCTGDLTINGEVPSLTCPDSVVRNADAGGVTAMVTWDPISLSGGCGDGPTPECTATHSTGVDVTGLLETGGRFPVGTSTFRCSSVDQCGGADSCEWSVTVNPANSVEIDLQLSPTVVSGPLERCIELTFYSSCVENPVRMDETITFGGIFDLRGRAEGLTFKIPPGQYTCVTARDALHSLRSVSDMPVVGSNYVAKFENDPFFGGNWLIGGNLNRDAVIDILDFGVFIAKAQTPVTGTTPCGTSAPHADINGDGFVDSLDFTFISLNFLSADKDSCCPGSAAAASTEPLTEVSVSQLRQMGMGDLAGADLNGDGVLNMADISAYMEGQRPTRLDVKPRSIRDRAAIKR